LKANLFYANCVYGEVTSGMEHSKIPDLIVSIIEEFLNKPMPKKD
jgi:hypothetical protein